MSDKLPTAFRIDDLPPYALGHIAEAVHEARLQQKDVIDLSQFNPDLAPATDAVDKLVQATLQPQNHRYSASQGIAKLREEVSHFYLDRYSVKLAIDTEIVVTLGTKEALSHLLLAMIRPGESVLVPTPAYPIHRAAVFISGANFIGIRMPEHDVRTPLKANDDIFFSTLEETYEQTWPRPKIMVLSFPHNPSTTVVEKSFFERLVEVAKEKQFVLIHDFAYANICFDGYRAPSILEVSGAKEVAVELYSMSKGFNVPGWRVGFCVGNPRIIQALKKIKSYIDFGVFQPLQIATIQLLKEAERLTNEVSSTYQHRRDIFFEAIIEENFQLNIEKPLATPFLWLKLPDKFVKHGSLSLAELLLHESQLAVSPGIGFDIHSDDRVRLSLVDKDRRLRLAAKKFVEIVFKKE